MLKNRTRIGSAIDTELYNKLLQYKNDYDSYKYKLKNKKEE